MTRRLAIASEHAGPEFQELEPLDRAFLPSRVERPNGYGAISTPQGRIVQREDGGLILEMGDDLMLAQHGEAMRQRFAPDEWSYAFHGESILSNPRTTALRLQAALARWAK